MQLRMVPLAIFRITGRVLSDTGGAGISVRVPVREVADRFNRFTRAASLRTSACGWYPAGEGHQGMSGGNLPHR
jgi:hypothetical protein